MSSHDHPQFFRTRRSLFIFLLSLGIILFAASNAFAAWQVTLQWDPNREPDLAGYKVFSRSEGQAYQYGSPVWEGAATTCAISNLNEGTSYYFVVRAIDTDGLESADSLEVKATSPGETIARYNLTVDTEGSGTVLPNPAGGIYNEGSIVALSATAATGWTFSSWSGNLSGTTNPVTLTMDSDKQVTAAFVQVPQHHLTVTVNPAGAGSVGLDPSGGTYDENESVTLTAHASPGWVFSGWSGQRFPRPVR